MPRQVTSRRSGLLVTGRSGKVGVVRPLRSSLHLPEVADLVASAGSSKTEGQLLPSPILHPSCPWRSAPGPAAGATPASAGDPGGGAGARLGHEGVGRHQGAVLGRRRAAGAGGRLGRHVPVQPGSPPELIKPPARRCHFVDVTPPDSPALRGLGDASCIALSACWPPRRHSRTLLDS